MQRSLRYFRQNTSGVAVIEFALILPVLLLILLGVIEFGVYFMKEQIVQRTVSNAISDIKQDPSDASSQMNKDNAVGSGSGVVDYTAIGNYICAQSYATVADAKSGLCAAGDWVTTAPTTGYTAGAPYFVAVVAYVQESSFTDLFKNYIPPIKVSSVFKVGGSGSSALNNLPAGVAAGFCATTAPGGHGMQQIVMLIAPAINVGGGSPCGCAAGWTIVSSSLFASIPGSASAWMCIKQ